MAIYPGAIVKLKPHQPGEGLIVPYLVIWHSICGGYKNPGLSGLDWLEDPKNPLESTFAIDGDGTVYQIRDTTWHCDANLDANDRAISIEFESSIEAKEPYTAAQLHSGILLTKWACKKHNIPIRRANVWNGSGIGWHTMWGAPSHWTPVNKDCPGPARIAQMPAVIAAVANPNYSGDVMTWTASEEAEILKAARQINGAVGAGQTSFETTVETILGTVQSLVNLVRSGDTALSTAIADSTSAEQAAVLAAIAAIPTGTIEDSDLEAMADKIVAKLTATGIPVDSDAVLDALKTRLEA